MTDQQLLHPLDLLIHHQIHQSHDWAMGEAMDEDQLAEILVCRDEYTSFLKSQIHQPFVAGFWINGQRGQNVVSFSDQKPGERLRRDAHIEQELHDARALGIRSWIDSPAIDRRA